MSETETPIIPLPHVLYDSGADFSRYRPAFTSLRIDLRPNGGRSVTVNDDGHTIIFELSAEQAAKLATLLLESSKTTEAA